MAELTDGLEGPGLGKLVLARIKNERYGTEMGIRKIRVNLEDDNTSDWYPAPRTPSFLGELREIDQLRQIQESAFGSFSPAQVIRQALFQDRGEIYIDQALLPMPARARIYSIVIDKKLDEGPIEEELIKIDTGISGGNLQYYFPGYFTDHNGLGYPAESVELYEFGLLKHIHVKTGIATDFLKLTKKAYEDEHGKKSWWAIVRLNNIASLKALMRGLGVTVTRLQATPDEGTGHFSEETNFGVDTSVTPLKKIPRNSRPKVWNPTEPVPSTEDFLVRMPQGDESGLKYWRPHLVMLKKVMAVGKAPTRGEHYVMRKVLGYAELERLGIKDSTTPHLFFTRNW